MKIRESCLQTGNFIYKPGISLTKQDFHLQRGILGLQRGFSGYYLPKNHFSGKICYTTVSELANIFDVSFQAALNRCIDLAFEDCMVVCSIDRRIKWFNATEDFPLLVNRKTVSELSGADELFDMQIFQVKTIEEPGYIWFCNADERDVVEESIAFPNYNEVISIIHLKDEL